MQIDNPFLALPDPLVQPEQTTNSYRLDDQIGYTLRRAFQRHHAIFQDQMVGGLTPTQFAAMVRLETIGTCSQNRLGRLTSMDAATIKGVIDRLRARKLIKAWPDEHDRRRSLLALTERGVDLMCEARAAGNEISAQTLAPLDEREQIVLNDLLRRIAE